MQVAQGCAQTEQVSDGLSMIQQTVSSLARHASNDQVRCSMFTVLAGAGQGGSQHADIRWVTSVVAHRSRSRGKQRKRAGLLAGPGQMTTERVARERENAARGCHT